MTPDGASLLGALRTGELEPLGWLVGSSNNAMVVRVWPAGSPADGFGGPLEANDLLGVWKPTLGERPLFDFPLGTLTRREVAAYHVSEALGWGIVPPTLLRDGPHGEGMLQRWIDVDPEADVVDIVNGDDPRLRRIALFDAIVNNTDRKAGHLLPISGGHLFAVDHGVTFSVVPKLRTVLWAWEDEPFSEEELAGLARVRVALASPDATEPPAEALGSPAISGPLPGALGSPAMPGQLTGILAQLLSLDEVEATQARIADLIATGRFPSPNPEWPAIPWPPY